MNDYNVDDGLLSDALHTHKNVTTNLAYSANFCQHNKSLKKQSQSYMKGALKKTIITYVCVEIYDYS